MNLSRNRFFFSYVRPLGQVRLSERREAEARPDKLSRGFVCASNKLLPLSLEFRESTAYPCACLRSLGQKREKACQRMNSRQSFWLFPAWISMRMESRDSFYVQDGSFRKTRRSCSDEHLRRAGYEAVRIRCGILQVKRILYKKKQAASCWRRIAATPS